MALPEFTMRQLMEAGVHFGHQTHRWNPRMRQYIYGDRNGIHIIDLTQTVPLLHQALVAVRDCVARGGRILFVGTKRQAQAPIADAAERSAQYFMNHRWMGGTLTNWSTVSKSIQRLKKLDEQLGGEAQGFTKRERLQLERQRDKLQLTLGGIRELGGKPDLLFVVDTNKEELALMEAQKLRIPVIAVLDSNSSPDGVAYPIPGNDDAARAIGLYCDLIALAAIDGMQEQLGAAGVDIGEFIDAPMEAELAELEADAAEAGVDLGDAALSAEASVVAEATAEADAAETAEAPAPAAEEAPAAEADADAKAG
ncbi:MAG: 30S ribosomal protein S2 [Neomegalonema sp.]|nr:30S ribosomal protein S2 [Neomegalonema sp.]